MIYSSDKLIIFVKVNIVIHFIIGGACKEKWRNLRIVYMRHMKSSRYSGTGRRKRRYYLSDAMQFLLPFIKITPPVPPKIVSPEDAKEKEKTFYDAYRFNKEDDQSEDTIPEAWKVPEVKIETDDDQSNDTNQDSEGNSSKKRSIQEIEYNYLIDAERLDRSTSCFPDTNDPIRSFLVSLVPELNEMNASQFKSFKRRVLALIDDITDEGDKA